MAAAPTLSLPISAIKRSSGPSVCFFLLPVSFTQVEVTTPKWPASDERPNRPIGAARIISMARSRRYSSNHCGQPSHHTSRQRPLWETQTWQKEGERSVDLWIHIELPMPVKPSPLPVPVPTSTALRSSKCQRSEQRSFGTSACCSCNPFGFDLLS